jgi:uncharacterized protein (PEP-CTERM system associated)
MLCSSIPSAVAAAWTTQTEIGVRETYNDNATFGTSGAEEDDFITELSAGLRIDGRGARLSGNFEYRPLLLFYARNSQEDRLVNFLRASGNLEVLEKFFFIDAFASISQEFISPFGARPGDITIATPNRTETRSVGVSPYVRGVLGWGHEYELRYRHLWTSSDAVSVSDVESQYWTGRLASPVRLFGWALEYEQSKIEQEDFTLQPDRESRLARARLLFQPDYAWRFSVSGGREENNFELLREMKSSDIYGAGVTWNPNARTRAEAYYEERFFGPSRLARLTHRTRLTAWNINYSLGTSDYQQELLLRPTFDTAALLDSIFTARIPDPAARRAAVEQFMRTAGIPSSLTLSDPLLFYTTQIFLQERIDASAAIIGVRNSISFNIFASQSDRVSEVLPTAIFDAFLLGDRIKTRGFGLRADHKLAPFTSVGASATRTNSVQEDPTTLAQRFETRNDYFTLTLNHTLSPRTNTFAGVGVSEEDSEDFGSRTSHTVFVGLTHRF